MHKSEKIAFEIQLDALSLKSQPHFRDINNQQLLFALFHFNMKIGLHLFVIVQLQNTTQVCTVINTVALQLQDSFL